MIAEYERENRELSLTAEEMEEMRRLLRAISAEAEILIQSAAIEAISSVAPTFNFSRFQSVMMNFVRTHYNESYPAEMGGFDVNASIENISASIEISHENGNRDLPVPAGIRIALTIEVAISSDRVNLHDRIEISKRVETAIPYLAHNLERLSETSTTQASLGKWVQSLLMQIAQLRVLQGYGSPDADPTRSTENILTIKDVESIVNLCIQILEKQIFGTVDPAAVEAFSNETINSENQVRTDLLKALSGEIDLWNLYTLICNENVESQINLKEFARQIIFSLIDRLVLRFLEYTHIFDIAEFQQSIFDLFDRGWQNAVEFMTGVDIDLERTIGWVEDEFERIGVPRSVCEDIFSGSSDIRLAADPKIIYISDCERNLVPLAVGTTDLVLDIPAFSIMASDSWSDLSDTFWSDIRKVGTIVESTCIDICRRLTENIPSIEITIPASDSGSIVPRILEEAERLLRSLDEEIFDCEVIPNVYPIETEKLSRLRDFLAESWESLFPFKEIFTTAKEALSRQLADMAIFDDPSVLPDNWKQEAAETIMRNLDSSSLESWRSRLASSIECVSRDSKNLIIHLIEREIQNTYPDFRSNPIISWFSDRIPNEIIRNAMLHEIRSLREQTTNMTGELCLDQRIDFKLDKVIELRGHLESSSSKSVTEIYPVISQYPAFLEAYEIVPEASYSVENIDPLGKLHVCIYHPTDSTGSLTESTHYTSFRNSSGFPYETNWFIRVRGALELTTCDIPDSGLTTGRIVSIDIEIPLTVLSGWPLSDVEYKCSDTLISDACDLFLEIKNRIWRFVSPLVEVHCRAFTELIDGLSKVSKYLLGFAERMGKLYFDFANEIASRCLNVLEKIRSSAIWNLIEASIDLLGKAEVKFTYGPFTVIASCSLPDLLFRKAKDMLRVVIIAKHDTFTISMGFRFAKLSNGELDIITNSTIKCASVTVDLRLDPLMKIRHHLFDISARWRGYRLDIWAPEVDDYRHFGVKLSDLPGIGTVLSSIPIPPLGISVSVDAGLSVRYGLPLRDQICINEVEQNPKGGDSGNEWVEIYNPLDREISLDGYSLETVHGAITILPLTGNVNPRGYRVFDFPKLSLDNGDPSDTFARGDKLILRDDNGKPIDRTPLIADNENDRRTWQRSWDGAPKWSFEISTKAKSNGNPLINTYPDLLAKLCVDSLIVAFERESDNISFSLGFVKNLLSSFLKELLLQTAEFAASLVHEVVFFIDIAINDLSGSVGVGFRFKVSITGELVRQGILWLMEQLTQIFGNLIFDRCMSIDLIGDSHPFEAIYLGYDAYARIGTPKLLSLLFNACDIPSEIKLTSSFSFNLAAIGGILNKSWGDWNLLFGLHIDDLPGLSLIPPLDVNREKVDLWLIRGKLYPK